MPRDEIVNAIMLVLANEISTPLDDLVPKVARIFKYQHTGRKIQDAIKQQVNRLKRNRKIIDSQLGLRLSN